MWSAASKHQSENLDPIQFEALQIEPRVPKGASLQPFAAGKADPVATDPKHFHLELDNEYVRVLRVNVGAHDKLTLVERPESKSVVAYLTDYKAKVTEAGGKSNQDSFQAKQVRFLDAGAAHKEEIASDSPIEFIQVEFKAR
jgi:hypothetical protein